MRKLTVLIFLLCIFVFTISCQERKSIFGVWALESNDYKSQSYLVLDRIENTQVLILFLDMKETDLNRRYVGMQLSPTEISFRDPGGAEWRIILFGEKLEAKSEIKLPEYEPFIYTRVRSEEGGWK